MNTFESNCIQKMMEDLKMQGYIVVNSCAITAESERQVRQEVRKLKRENPDFHLILTGCSGNAHTETFLKMQEVDFIISNEFKLKKQVYQQIKEFFDNKNEKNKETLQQSFLTQTKNGIPANKNNAIDDNDWEYIYHFEDRSRAFVPVQTGCNHFCAFCIVPFTRGQFHSYNPQHIIEQVRIFVENGYKEVVLTGIDITDYGKDIRGQNNIDTLGKLCKAILKQTTLARLRLSSVDVAEIDADIMDLVADEPRFMPYFHISLQSGSNSVLKRMRRRHTREDVFEFCSKVLKLRPETAFGADIITGFPEETEEEFLQSVDLVKTAPITFIHPFPYSRRERTLAYLMNDNVPKKVKKDRVKTLIDLGQENLQKMYKQMAGRPQKCLIERNCIARAENFIQIQIDKKLENKITAGTLQVVIPHFKDEVLVATDISTFKKCY